MLIRWLAFGSCGLTLRKYIKFVTTGWSTTQWSRRAASRFSWLVAAIGRIGCWDAPVARRCVGWGFAAIMSAIWERDMADWFGSRAEPKYLYCANSVLAPGPNQHLVISTHILGCTCAVMCGCTRRWHGRTLQITVHPAASLHGSTLSASSVSLVCRSVAAGSMKGESPVVLQ